MKKQIPIIIAILLVAIAGLFIYGQAKHGAETPKERVKIGVLAPLSGAAAELGQHIQRGLDLANTDLGEKYQLVYEDDKCTDVASAESAALKFIGLDEINLVIGPLCAPPYQAVAGTFNQAEVVFMHTSGVTPPFLESAGEFGIAGLTTTIADEDAFLAEYIYNKKDLKKLAVFVWNQAWAQEHRKGFVDAYEKLGGEIVFNDTFEIEETDFRTALLKLDQVQADGVFIVGLNFQNGMIVKQMREQGLTLPAFGQFEIEDPAFLENAGEAANGVVYVYPKIDESLSETRAFQSSYENRYETEPNYYAYVGYDALQIFNEALEECDEEDSRCVITFIRGLKNYPGVSGKITINDDGTIDREFEIKTIKDGAFVLVE